MPEQEDEARLQKMPDKLVAFNILRAAGKQGMRVADVVAAIKALPEHAEWDNKRSVYLRNVSRQNLCTLFSSLFLLDAMRRTA